MSTSREDAIRTIVEECWSDPDGLDRMAGLLAPGYVHHSPFGDGGFDRFRAGMRHVDELFGDRHYRVAHVVDDGTLVAAVPHLDRDEGQRRIVGHRLGGPTTAGCSTGWSWRTGTRSSRRPRPLD